MKILDGSKQTPLGIEGIPAVDGPYWYYKLGEEMPSLVLIGDYKGKRAIKEDCGIQYHWFPGEFFVGPIEPPFATPERLAALSEEDWCYARANPQYPTRSRSSTPPILETYSELGQIHLTPTL